MPRKSLKLFSTSSPSFEPTTTPSGSLTSTRPKPSQDRSRTLGGAPNQAFARRASTIMRILSLPVFFTKNMPARSTGDRVASKSPRDESSFKKLWYIFLFRFSSGSKYGVGKLSKSISEIGRLIRL